MDFNIALINFKKYLNNFDASNPMIDQKIKHTYGVVAKSEYIAQQLQLSDEDIYLAKIIALLHDIGRFEQAKKYSDYNDYQNLDHAQLGVMILMQDHFIRAFIENNNFDELIKKAILNHNKLKIEDNLTARELLHAKIIRDADKLDNFNVLINEDFKYISKYTKTQLANSTISKEVYDQIMQRQTIDYSTIKTPLDFWLSGIAYIFDINFKVSLDYIHKNDLMTQIIDRIDYQNPLTQKQILEIKQLVTNI